MSNLFHILQDIIAERRRQNQLKAEGRFPCTMDEPEMTNLTRLAVLGEEYGEVCRALQDQPSNLRTEIVQLGACCVAWLQYLDSMQPTTKESTGEDQ